MRERLRYGIVVVGLLLAGRAGLAATDAEKCQVSELKTSAKSASAGSSPTPRR